MTTDTPERLNAAHLSPEEKRIVEAYRTDPYLREILKAILLPDKIDHSDGE